MIYIDTHAHICEDFYGDDTRQIANEAISDNVKKIINVGIDYKTSKAMIAIAKKYKGIYSSVGVHPTDCYNSEEILKIEKLITKENKVIAIGEIGLDYFHLKSGNAPSKKTQIEMFKKQVDIALKHNLPIIIHCRDAFDDLYDVLKIKKYENVSGVLHTFAGDEKQLKKFLDLGFYISFSGVVTFKNAETNRVVAKATPLNRILSETDSPFLTPMPFRGKKNHPKNVVYVAQKLAEIKEVSIEKICSYIEQNTKDLFSI